MPSASSYPSLQEMSFRALEPWRPALSEDKDGLIARGPSRIWYVVCHCFSRRTLLGLSMYPYRVSRYKLERKGWRTGVFFESTETHPSLLNVR